MLNALFVFPDDQLYCDIGKQKEGDSADFNKRQTAIENQIIFMLAQFHLIPAGTHAIAPIACHSIKNNRYQQQRHRKKETTDKSTG